MEDGGVGGGRRLEVNWWWMMFSFLVLKAGGNFGGRIHFSKFIRNFREFGTFAGGCWLVPGRLLCLGRCVVGAIVGLSTVRKFALRALATVLIQLAI